MPDESCRKCGGMLLELLVCAKCRAPTQFICRICAHKTTPRFHEQMCFRLDGQSKHDNSDELILVKGIPQISS